jgi:fructokinase
MDLGLVELGGTKTLIAAGTTPEDLSEPVRVETSDPDTTLAAVVGVLREMAPAAVGIATFGPVELRKDHPDYGNITSTPKPGWQGTPLLSRVHDALGDVPVRIESDVNAAALGEGSWGAATGLSDFVYVTVGTGVGGGAVAGGELVGGTGHPEMGHIAVRRLDGDDYAGRCPYHGDCLEGMASGPALQDRFGPWEAWGPEAVGLAASYVAQGLRAMVYFFAPQAVIVGGGVASVNGFHEALTGALTDELAGYPGRGDHEEGFVLPPGLGELSALVGCLLVARRAG